jgi:beta-N-acetylhexosaminidase
VFYPSRLLPAVAAAFLIAAACGTAEERPREAGAAQAPEPPRVPALQLDAEAAAWVEETLAGMTLRQRVAQLVFPWISGQSESANPQEFARMRNWVTRDEVGGLIVSTGAPSTLAAKLNAAQARAAVPLLIVSDLETGPGMRLRPGGTDVPPSMALRRGARRGARARGGRVTGMEARAVGIHMTLGPLFDVNSNPRQPDHQRPFLRRGPGAGGAAGDGVDGGGEGDRAPLRRKALPRPRRHRVDSHVGLAADRGGLGAALRGVEIAPFARAVHAGMDGMLVGHIAAVGLEGPDAPPASLSPRMVDDVLRGGSASRGW